MDVENAAKERAANLILVVVLALDAVVLATAVWPGLPRSADLLDRLRLVPVPLNWAFLAAVAIFVLVQLHYLMRFVWGEGQWPVHSQQLWEVHSSYFTALLVIGAAGAAITLFLLPM
jgi:hypothetical protein